MKLLCKFAVIAVFLPFFGCDFSELEALRDDISYLKEDLDAIKKVADKAQAINPQDLIKPLLKEKFFKVYKPGQVKETFSNVAGMSFVKNELQDFIDNIKDPASFSILGAEAPKGVIFYGPPGTGKTQIARALAGEVNKDLKVNFIVASGAAFEAKYMGVAPGRVSELFNFARQNKPAIIFIDEFDAVAGVRSEERKNTTIVNQLLTELDGFDQAQSSGIYLIAATNLLSSIDPAVLRPGRIDRAIHIGVPDDEARRAIIEFYLKKRVLISGIDIKDLAKKTKGFGAADIKNLINEARIFATKRKAKKVEQKDIDAGLKKIAWARFQALKAQAR